MIEIPVLEKALKKGLKLKNLGRFNSLKEEESDNLMVRSCVGMLEDMINTDFNAEQLNAVFEQTFHIIEKYKHFTSVDTEERPCEVCC